MATPRSTDLWQRFIARRVTLSRDIRGPGWSGFGECAREHLAGLDLSTIPFDQGLPARLDDLTDEIVHRWHQIAGEPPGEAWGLARKTINWFLIDVSFHVDLRRCLDADDATLADALEIPLDRNVGDRLISVVRPGNHWPRGEGVSFPSLRNLEAQGHAQWQTLAAHVATALGTTRAGLALLLSEGIDVNVELEKHDEVLAAVEDIRERDSIELPA